MNRMYELAIVAEPRQTEDDVQAICDRMKELIEKSGSQVFHVDDWGKRKLAYPIRKFNEGRYTFFYVTTEGDSVPDWSTIERLLQQDERILRHLVVRTDEDLSRAFRKGKVFPEVPGISDEDLRAFLGVPPAEVAEEAN
ncbi:MAG: 30S ribosomal protein S6 [Thermoanaerobaculia bacterium]|nr:30S ribosomal protein S6 [Thermoanaerobaculia bacterium]